MSPGFQLPSELVEMIVQYVDKIDLITLRLTNKALRTIATCRFAIEYFTNVTVFMSRHSLQMLNEICDHPIFGPQIRTINFASQRLLKSGLNSIQKSVSAAHESCPFSKAATDAAMNVTHAYSLAYGEQQSMSESGEAVLLLTSALDKLHTHHRPVGLGLVDNVWNQPEEGVLGCYTFGRDCFEQYNSWNYWECVRTGTLKVLLAAAYCSHCRIDSLSMNCGLRVSHIPGWDDTAYLEDPYSSELDLLDDSYDDILRHVCSSLRVVEVELSDSDIWEGATPDSLAKLLELATNIEVLRCELDCETLVDRFSRFPSLGLEKLAVITRSLTTSSLREVHLSHCIVPQDDMVNFVVRNHATLRSLEIRGCCISSNGSWATLLTSVLDKSHKLEQLIVTDLYREFSGPRSWTQMQHVMAGTRIFTKYEDMRDELQVFISELEGSGF